MRIPNQIQIAGILYRVEMVDGFSHDDALLGQIDYVRCTININSKPCEQVQFESLIHEVLHGVVVATGEFDHNEKDIEAQGRLLSQVIKQLLNSNDVDASRSN